MLKILLVEDHKWVTVALTSLLDGLSGVEIKKHLMSENEALAWLTHNQFGWDLIITDLVIGKGSGLQILDACRMRKSHQKIIVLSNYLDEEMKRRCFMLGANEVFEKASDVDKMVDYCRNLSDVNIKTRAMI